MLDEIESKTVHKGKESVDRRQRSKTMTHVKPVKNISKILSKSFLEIIPIEKEVLPSHKLEDHAYE